MQPQTRPPTPFYERLSCPICRSHLAIDTRYVNCTNAECSTTFPIVNGIPVLLNEENSVFSFEDFLSQRNTTFNLRRNKTKQWLHQFVPTLSRNINSKENYAQFARLLMSLAPVPRVLVVGGSILGHGMEGLVAEQTIEFVDTDVSFGPRTVLICDAHDIPFEDETFDGVIAQAVLEHVTDPYRCVEEIHRVLKPSGLVYAETPFMQQVHLGRFDFTRFTHLGHRRLFRKFDEVNSGVVGGPGMALAWSYRYFLLSFTHKKSVRSLIRIFTGFTAFYLKYFDHYLANKPGALDAAAGFYFIGRKSNQILPDKELVKLYRGLS